MDGLKGRWLLQRTAVPLDWELLWAAMAPNAPPFCPCGHCWAEGLAQKGRCFLLTGQVHRPWETPEAPITCPESS